MASSETTEKITSERGHHKDVIVVAALQHCLYLLYTAPGWMVDNGGHSLMTSGYLHDWKPDCLSKAFTFNLLMYHTDEGNALIHLKMFLWQKFPQ